MMQSPTSINTYLQCPRKYHYKYIQRLPTKENATLLVGTITHRVLAEFVSQRNGNYSRANLMKILDDIWNMNKNALLNDKHFDEIKTMLGKWYDTVKKKNDGKILSEYFRKLKTEVMLKSYEYNVCGVIDVVDESTGLIVEYKTSSKDEIKNDHKIQLGIYALLFWEKFKCLPKNTIIHFLRHGEKDAPVNQESLNEAKRICKSMKIKTLPNDIESYPKKTGPLCKWRDGECEFYGKCFCE